jgi:hypothetical protein
MMSDIEIASLRVVFRRRASVLAAGRTRVGSTDEASASFSAALVRLTIEGLPNKKTALRGFHRLIQDFRSRSLLFQ